MSRRIPQEEEGKDRANVELKGVVEQIGTSRWVVSGQVLVLDGQTSVEGVPAVGARVQVRGVRQENGTILALKIVVAGPENEETPAPRATPEVHPAPTLPGAPPVPPAPRLPQLGG